MKVDNLGPTGKEIYERVTKGGLTGATKILENHSTESDIFEAVALIQPFIEGVFHDLNSGNPGLFPVDIQGNLDVISGKPAYHASVIPPELAARYWVEVGLDENLESAIKHLKVLGWDGGDKFYPKTE